jgi:hypothetical protein
MCFLPVFVNADMLTSKRVGWCTGDAYMIEETASSVIGRFTDHCWLNKMHAIWGLNSWYTAFIIPYVFFFVFYKKKIA